MVKTRKAPLRMCLGCREMKPKKEMIRIVRNAESQIFVDHTSKASGRGAYVCPSRECFERVKKTNALSRALDQAIDDQVMERLMEAIVEG